MSENRPFADRRTPESARTPFAGLTATEVACVTQETGLVAELRTAAPGVPIAAASNPQALADLLLAGTCGVLVIDLVELGTSATTVIHHLASQFPDVPIIGIGTRHDEAEVAGLISAGEIYRFLHRPVSAGRAKTFLEAALRRHEELRPTVQALKGATARHAPATPITERIRTGARGAFSPSATARLPAEPAGRRSLPPLPILGGVAVAVAALGLGLVLRDTTGRKAATPAATHAAAPSRTAVRGLLRPATPAAAAHGTPAAGTARALAADGPRKTQGARPVYPEAARASGVEGWVDVHFTVSPDGTPTNVTVTLADPKGIFEDAALEAVGRWRYAPQATPSEVDQRIYFRLSDPVVAPPADAQAPATAAPAAAPAPAPVAAPEPRAPVAEAGATAAPALGAEPATQVESPPPPPARAPATTESPTPTAATAPAAGSEPPTG